MNFLKNISINQRIQLTVAMLLLLLFAAAAYSVSKLSTSRVNKSIEVQANVYLNQLSALITEVEKQTGGGFTHIDYATLKPYFNQAAFYQTDFPFLIDSKGNYAIHLYKEGQKYPRERLNEIFTRRNGSLSYTDFIKGNEQEVRLFFKKVESIDYYIALPISINEAHQDLSMNRIVLILIIIASSVSFQPYLS